MKRTTVYLDPDLEVQLKIEALRQQRPMAELHRDALRHYLADLASGPPPGAGEFASGLDDTADRSEELLGELGFGEDG